MDTWTILIICTVLICFYLVKKGWNQASQVADTTKRVVAQYKLNEIYVSSEDMSLIGLNFVERKIVLGAGKLEGAYDYARISSIEVIENGVTVTSTNRGSQLLGSAIGGALLGRLGEVIGGLSGSTRSQERLRRITLKIFVDDPAHPVYSIPFFREQSSKGVDPDGPEARDAREKADRFHSHVVNAMLQAKRQSSLSPSANSASELRTLWEMKLAGALTDEEFAHQKSRILGTVDQARSGPA